MEFPRHEAGLILSHNEHRGVYQTLRDWLANQNDDDADWVSDEQLEKALAEDSCWRLQWYPQTPVGFFVIYAADLDALLSAASEMG